MSTKKLYPVLQKGQDVIIYRTGEKGKIIQLPQHPNTWYKIQVYPEREPRSLRITDFGLTTDPERTKDTKYNYNVLTNTPMDIKKPVTITPLFEGPIIRTNDPQFQETLEMIRHPEFTNSPRSLPSYGVIEKRFANEEGIYDPNMELELLINGGKKKKRKTKRKNLKKRKTKKK